MAREVHYAPGLERPHVGDPSAGPLFDDFAARELARTADQGNEAFVGTVLADRSVGTRMRRAQRVKSLIGKDFIGTARVDRRIGAEDSTCRRYSATPPACRTGS